ncbi:TetR/AcrR family transcriptional regulator [Methylopila sp. M107]|uniref:TetR/AcrR family transcriptional regulator n=1 Tax=Methylopila sp. M107 TaxID=1101190 RepID=UPI001FD9172B|nr:TetR/AcrR family transcriptional regulator [Methylopila sp. M107]
MTDMTAESSARTGLRRRAPRLAGDTRRALIVEAASRFFADQGFSGPTRDLAASIGVTQALLYRYFDSKSDLIDSVFATVFQSRWCDEAVERFDASAGAPMVERLVEVYEAMLPRMTPIAIRLLFRAGLDACSEPVKANIELTPRFTSALVEAWRREDRLPSLADRPLLEGERSLVYAMHDAMIMIRVREHVLQAVRRMSDSDQIRQVAETQDAGVRAVMRRLHDGEASDARLSEAGDQDELAAA